MREFTDRWGVPVQASRRQGVDRFDEAIEGLVALAGDPAAAARATVAADEDLPLGHLYRAYLALYATSRPGLKRARASLAACDRLEGRLAGRETHHRRAAGLWADGDWAGAAGVLAGAVRAQPRDLLAIKVAQDLAFFLGDLAGLRDVAEAALASWPPARAGWGFVQGIYAFGLEENGDYRGAEQRASAALADNPADVWAVHAMAHVYEMEGRRQEGVAFLAAGEAAWSGSYFAVHNWWHRALYHLDLGETAQVLALYDGPVRGARSSEWLDLVDAASLLWRLVLFGVDVGGRPGDLADDVEAVLDDPVYVFHDWHATMALALAGRQRRIGALQLANRDRSVGTNRLAAERAGLDLIEGFARFARGDHAGALGVLRAIGPRSRAVGGSHAQRDVIDLTLLAAAARSGRTPLVAALVAERARRRPGAAGALDALLGANGR